MIEQNFLSSANRDDLFPVFLIHHALAVGYFGYLWYLERRRFFKIDCPENRPGHILLLILFNLAAYSLNQLVPVFNESVTWLMVFLIIENLLFIFLALWKGKNQILTPLAIFFLGLALTFNIYQAIMVFPIMMIGLVASFFLGISLLAFVPLFYIIEISLLYKTLRQSSQHQKILWAGMLLPILVVSGYTFKWKMTEKRILRQHVAVDRPLHKNFQPNWISVAQALPHNQMAEDYLKASLVYQEFLNLDRGLFQFNRLSYSETLLHDPLISIASAFSKRNTLDDKTKIEILNFLFDQRHKTAERFWSGENLKTSRIVTNIELFADERLAFTEQILTIKNTRDIRKSRWRAQQEAFYTFQLPEGGVVTSLSLWINGEEQKGILTSKKKAKEAYNTIVGREARDPSVVYWMEGNKIRVRVFPCTPEKDRKFKLGVTAPLKLNNDHLIYNPITFLGPDYTEADAAIHIVSHGNWVKATNLSLEESEGLQTWYGNYLTDWSFSLPSSAFTNKSFVYKNDMYTLLPTPNRKEPFDPETVYLDLSSHWTKDEIKKVLAAFEGKEIMHILMNTSSPNPYSSSQVNLNALPSFTLFPFFTIKNPEKSIIITKGNHHTPNFDDLKSSRLRKQLFDYFSSLEHKIKVVDLAAAPSDYFKTLKEFDVLDYHYMTPQALSAAAKKGEFPKANEDESIVDIPNTGFSILQQTTPVHRAKPNNASDHLMRLFNYQLVMHSIGRHYFNKDYDEEMENKMVELSAISNIVTPVSSLIVLESQKDYDRFDIAKNKNSLGNAAITDAGAAPEPGEWALIILGLSFLAYLFFKNRIALLTRFRI